MPRLIFTLLASLSLLCSGQEAAHRPILPKRTLIQRYGFSLQPPVGWHAGVGNNGLPVFVNFPWSKMQAQLRLPAEGAIINVISWDSLLRRRGDDSLAGWANLDAVNAAPGTAVSVPLDTPQVTGISEALIVSFDVATFGPDDQAQRSVGVYWIYRHERFAAHLSYVLGDPKGFAYEDVLKQVVFSIRPA